MAKQDNSHTPVIPPTPQDRIGDLLPKDIENPEVRKQVVAKDLLGPDELEVVREQAETLYDSLVADTVALMNYGKSAVAELNALILRMQDEVETVEIEELSSGIRQVSLEMAGLRDRYDTSDPHVVEQIKEEISGKRGIFQAFRRVPSILKRLEIDHQNTEQMIDGVSATLQEKILVLLRNIALDDELYNQNQDELLDLIHVIAVMEVVKEMAQSEIKSLETPPNGMSQHDIQERKRTLSSFIHNLSQKVAEYKNRMFVGQSTTQQIMNRRDGNVSLVMKLDNQMELIVPLMRKTVQEWSQLIKSMQVSESTNILDDTANEWVKAAAEAGAELMPAIYERGSKPTLTADTITRVAEFVAKQSDELTGIVKDVQQRQQDASEAMVDANLLMQASADRLTDAALEDYMEKARTRLSKDHTEDEQEPKKKVFGRR